MRGHLTNLVRGLDGSYQVTITTRDAGILSVWDDLHEADVAVDMKKYHPRRSRDANAYFHVMCNQIAAALKISDSECKRRLVLDYGTLDRDDNGKIIGAKLPSSVDISRYYPYAKPYAETQENGREYTCYVFYKHTHELDSKEMNRLIDGTVQEAKQLGIETATPQEIAAMEAAWAGRAGRCTTKGEGH